MNVEQSLQVHLDEMYHMIDHALSKTNEESIKMRMVGVKDVEAVLIEEYNNGWIDLDRLQKLSKLMKDACTELVRQYTFKVENIYQAEELKKILDSVKLHVEEGHPMAIYDQKRQPRFNGGSICGGFANKIHYLWLVYMTPFYYSI